MRVAMSVLSLDTASPNPSVAVLCGDRLFEQALPADGRASEELLPAVARAFASAREELSGCERIAVCAGPGSFTGVRVGLATAWGIGRALGIPVEAVSTLEALAEAARHPGLLRVAAFLDAGRSELVGAIFDFPSGRARALAPTRRLGFAEAREFAGDASIAALPPGLVEGSRTLSATLAAALALAVARTPREGPAAPVAIYSRPSAAQEKRDERDTHGAP
jgi:tRNA threonylcarbamoyladenosine biosynthesis protein TsaB